MMRMMRIENVAANKVENPEEFIEVFDKVNKIFSRQTDSRLGVSAISAQPLVSKSMTSKASLGLVRKLSIARKRPERQQNPWLTGGKNRLTLLQINEVSFI